MTAPGTSRDRALAAGFLVAALTLTFGGLGEPVRADPLGAVMLLPLTAPLLWRVTAPVGALGALLVTVIALDAAFGPDVPRCVLVPPITFLLVFSAATRLHRLPALLALGIGAATLIAEGLTTYGGFAVVLVVLAAALWFIGRVAHSRRRLAAELEQRTAELQTLRDDRARLEVTAERARLSTDLDELLRHRLARLARLADAPPTDRAAATRTLRAIEQGSREALEEMRAVVGVLRDDAPSQPQPTLAHLEAMLDRRRADARLTVEGDPHVLPPGIELSAYRIVEHLLDALDDAPEVEVRVVFRADALELGVSGNARRTAKDALDRARERVALHHGTLRSSTRGSRAETVASLPLLAGG